MGAMNVERVNGLIYAVVMESRGIYMSPDIPAAKRYGGLLLQFNERIASVVADWRKHVGGADAAQFAEFASASAVHGIPQGTGRASATEVGPAKGREWGDNEVNRSVRTALNKDLDGLAKSTMRVQQVYSELDGGVARTAWFLARDGGRVRSSRDHGHRHHRSRGGPAAAQHRARHRRGGGRRDRLTIPHADRQDEVGALARSIVIFQQAIERNAEFNRTVAEDAAAREERNAAHPNAVEPLPRLGRADARRRRPQRRTMRATAQNLTDLASQAKDDGSAAAASDDTATNVNDRRLGLRGADGLDPRDRAARHAGHQRGAGGGRHHRKLRRRD